MSGPQFFSFHRPPDWRRGSSNHLSFIGDRLSIVQEEVYRPHRRYTADHPRLAHPISDAAADREGRWLLLDGAGAVWKVDTGSGHMETLLSPGHGWFGSGSAIAVMSDFWVAADPTGTPSIVALSADNAQVLWTLSEWRGEPIQGIAVDSDALDHLVVLALFQEGRLRLLRYDSFGREDGSIELVIPEAETEWNESGRRFDVTAGSHGEGWVLDRAGQQIIQFSFESGTSTEFVSILKEEEPAFAVCAAEPDGCWVARQSGAARSLQRFDASGRTAERGDAGIGVISRLVSSGNRRLHLWDGPEGSVTTLRPVPETAVWKPFGRRIGVWISGSLDSTSAETEWHKLVVNAMVEPDTQVRIRYYASDRKEAAISGEWVDLDRFIMDDTVPVETKLDALSSLWSEPIVDPKDALFVRAKGRYLWLYMELIGSENHTPSVRGLQVHFPRASYLEYLPALYQQDPKSRDFLDRYLSMFQTMLDETDDRIKEIPRSFDPEAATGASLRWLLGWLGLSADDHWTEDQLRLLLRHAPSIHKLRGTRYALETLISIYTGERPIILEYDHLKPLKENPELGVVAEKLYATDPHGFNVLVKLEHADTETKRVTLQHLIDSCKPAFATGRLIVLQPWVYMDLHSYLGLNTVLSEPALLKLDGLSSMPHHTITIDIGQDNRVDQHTRLELDSRLE